MSLIVQKFGGSSVADVHHIFNVAKKVVAMRMQGDDIIVVVSAQGDTTDDLLKSAEEITLNPSKREMDALLSAGEQMSASLLAMAIEHLGHHAISLTGWQAGFKTDSAHGNANIIKIITDRVKSELSNKKIVVIAGFQGVDENNNITTLGRGGSDTSAVAIAAAMNAGVCKIYTDVDGVYTADPRIVPSARKLKNISYNEMFELSRCGAQVLSDECITTAKAHGVEIEVLSSMENKAGTLVKGVSAKSSGVISGISAVNDLSKVTITNIGQNLFNEQVLPGLKARCINPDILLTPIGKKAEDKAVCVIASKDMQEAIEIIKSNDIFQNGMEIFYDKNKSKISVVNLSDNMNINIASLVFETLQESKINIEMVGCNNKRVSVLVDSSDAHAAVNSIHSKLFEEDNLI